MLPFLIVSALCLAVEAQEEGMTPVASQLKTFFTGRSAEVDKSIPDSIREHFEADEGEPLKSVVFDLNGDGRTEKFVLNSVLSNSGGNQWLVFDSSRGIPRGLLIGSIVFILRRVDEGYPRIKTFWRQGATMAVVFEYVYSRGRYVRTKSHSLSVPETDEFFRNMPPLDLNRELVEIKLLPTGAH